MEPFRHLRAVVLDWAGTTVDHGSLAPIRALVRAFGSIGLEVSMDEVRDGMGLAKRDHIAHLLRGGPVRDRFVEVRGHVPTDEDAEDAYAAFVPLQTAVLAEGCELIDGTLPCVEALRARGLPIGSTTGYTRPMLDGLLAAAAIDGYAPDAALCPDDVGAGRPSPLMLYANAVRLRVAPLAAIVKVGDTPVDVAEGRAAGTWTVAVAATGNEVGLDRDALAALDVADRAGRIARASERLRRVGADYVIDDLGGLDEVLQVIEARMALGDRPGIR